MQAPSPPPVQYHLGFQKWTAGSPPTSEHKEKREGGWKARGTFQMEPCFQEIMGGQSKTCGNHKSENQKLCVMFVKSAITLYYIFHAN